MEVFYIKKIKDEIYYTGYKDTVAIYGKSDVDSVIMKIAIKLEMTRNEALEYLQDV